MLSRRPRRPPVAIVSLLVSALLAAPDVSAQVVAVKRDSSKVDTLSRVVVRESASRARYAPAAGSAASKVAGPLRDVPQAVSVVGRAAIDDQKMQNMADVVRYIPGVGMAQGEGHRDAPVIRGNTSTADFFVDGVRDDGQYLRDLYNVERVEALKGANAMAFGRGGGGGVLNRVTKDAGFAPIREIVLEGGSFDHRRATADVGGGLTDRAAVRLNAMTERSATFRDATMLQRFGVNPSATFLAGDRTIVRVAAERFDDRRTVDRGIPSFAGGPVNVPLTSYFGDPEASRASSRVLSGGASVEHQATSGVTLRGRVRAARYDKAYQNVFAGAVTSAGTDVALQGYRSDILRDNVLSQGELSYDLGAGAVHHLLLAGVEAGTQATNNFRRTAYFNGGSATSMTVPVGSAMVQAPVAFAQSATDADNRVVAHVAGAYLQDQVRLAERAQVVAGLRVDRFALAYDNHRGGASLARTDRMVSPRIGVVLTPLPTLSLYSTLSVSHLPSSGDQFSSLTATTETLEPERFLNREAGVKWDARPALSVTAAAYQLDRTNTSAPDPLDASRVVQTGRQRSRGVELEMSGAMRAWWQVQGGLALQRAEIVERTNAAAAGASVPLVPHHTASLWNRVTLSPVLAAGVGVIHQGESFAAIDNTVTLPAFTRADAALFATLSPRVLLQVNVENLLGARYYPTSQGNNNILPGAPRTVRVSLSAGR